MRLLLVEDNPLIAQAIEKAGEHLQLQVDVATDGWDAIEKLRTESYAAIVVDADLPRHSGYGVLTYLRQENGERFENVVVMTSTESDVLQRVSAALHVVPKGGGAEEIAAAISGAVHFDRQ